MIAPGTEWQVRELADAAREIRHERTQAINPTDEGTWLEGMRAAAYARGVEDALRYLITGFESDTELLKRLTPFIERYHERI